MAVASVLPSLVSSNSDTPSSLKNGSQKWKYMPTTVQFDPAKHLKIEKPEWTKKLSDFGYDNQRDGVCEVAATAPFRVFTEDAIHLMRQDLLSAPVQENCIYSAKRSPCVARGYAPRYSKFTHDAWTHPKVLAAISEIAGLDLIPVMDYEIASTNIQLGPKGREGIRDLDKIPTAPLAAGSDPLEKSEYDDRPVDDWHLDSTPFVAVLMLSDTTGMKGGETAVQTKDGNVSVVPGPVMGKVVLMQGSRIRHSALRAENCIERIAMVTSFRPADPMLPDYTKIHGLHYLSDRSEIGLQWLTYRLKIAEDRCRIQREELLRRKINLDDKKAMMEFSEELKEFIDYTVRGLFEDAASLPPIY